MRAPFTLVTRGGRMFIPPTWILNTIYGIKLKVNALMAFDQTT